MSDARKCTLIITNSHDITVNRVIDRLGTDRVFRLNSDLWPDYRITVAPGEFVLENPAGRRVSRPQVAKCWWRKPRSRFALKGQRTMQEAAGLSALRRLFRRAGRPAITQAERFVEEEVAYALREIKNLLWWDGRLVLVEPASYMRLGKIVQMEIARDHFPVPGWEFRAASPGATGPGRRRIVKPLGSESLGEDTWLWTTAVAEDALDRSQPWLLQDLVEASHDVTVVFVRGSVFAFALDRASLAGETVDWREVGERTTPLWRPHDLPAEVAAAVSAFMGRVGLDYGRLDFLFDGAAYWFLEVNSNGEWDWLDPDGTGGVLDRIAAELDPDGPVHPLTVRADGRVPAPGDAVT
jgi:hypothetical protein